MWDEGRLENKRQKMVRVQTSFTKYAGSPTRLQTFTAAGDHENRLGDVPWDRRVRMRGNC